MNCPKCGIILHKHTTDVGNIEIDKIFKIGEYFPIQLIATLEIVYTCINQECSGIKIIDTMFKDYALKGPGE